MCCGGGFRGNGTGQDGVLLRHDYFADQMDVPVNADWAVNALAPSIVDPTNNALVVAAFDQTVEEGRGFIERVPNFATYLRLEIVGRAPAAPPAARTVGVKLYYRNSPNNAAVTAWANLVLSDLAIPVNGFFQYFSQSIQIGAGVGQVNINPGFDSQFELTRIAPSAGTNLAADFLIRRVSFAWAQSP